MKLESRKVEVLMKVSWRSCAVTYNVVEDVKHRSYSNSSKNIIKIKRSLVLFSLFISAVS